MDIEETITAIQDESDAYEDGPYEDTHGVRINHSRSVVRSVRLPEDEFTEISAFADRANVPVGSLITVGCWTASRLSGRARVTRLIDLSPTRTASG